MTFPLSAKADSPLVIGFIEVVGEEAPRTSLEASEVGFFSEAALHPFSPITGRKYLVFERFEWLRNEAQLKE